MSIRYGDKLCLSTNIGQGLGAGLRTFAIFFGAFARSGTLFGLEFLDAAELVDEAHLTSEERVTFGADIDSDCILGGASLERGTTGASDRDLIVCGVDG